MRIFFFFISIWSRKYGKNKYYISNRCGALSVGDQILSVDETIVENTAYSPDEVTALLDANSPRGFTQIQILPVQAMTRRRGNFLLLLL